MSVRRVSFLFFLVVLFFCFFVFAVCSVEMNCEKLAMAAATYANYGVNPLTHRYATIRENKERNKKTKKQKSLLTFCLLVLNFVFLPSWLDV